MRNIITIFRRDFGAHFASPAAYVTIGLFLLISGIVFFFLLSGFVQYCNEGSANLNIPININLMLFRPLLENIAILVLFVIPFITMRSFAEEQKSGTAELLLTAPVSVWQIVWGKFLAGFAFYLVLIAGTIIYPVLLFLRGTPELMPLIVGYSGLLLMGAVLVATGNFISSLTENLLVAAVASFGIFIVSWLLAIVSDYSSGIFGELMSNLSFTAHFEDFSKGIFDTSHLVFYLSVTALMLFLNYRSIISMRWRH